MDYFFPYDSQPQGDIYSLEGPVPVEQSAFVKYTSKPIQEFPRRFALRNGSCNGNNMNKRMIEFLKRNPVAGMEDSERERGRRHMISERVRRQKQKNSYTALHSILPPRTKDDKNSIIRAAVKEVEELKSLKEELERRNCELERKVLDTRKSVEEKEKGAKIKLRVAYPSSGIDSMLGILKCCKEKGSNIRSIHSLISSDEFSADIDIETKIEVAEVEEAVKRSLYEVERKSLLHIYPQREDYRSSWGHSF